MPSRLPPLAAGLLLALSGAGARPPQEPEAPDAGSGSVTLVFEGNESLADETLAAALEFLLADIRGRRQPDRFDVEDMTAEIRRLYSRRGFPDATASGRIERLRDGQRIAFTIKEGRRVFVGAIEFRFGAGSGQVSRKDLRACFSWNRSGFLIFGSEVYSDAARDEGLDSLRILYRTLGFLRVQVAAETGEPDGEGRVPIRVRIDEGSRFEVRKAPVFRGNRSYTSDELLKALELVLPAAASPRLSLILKGRLLDFYRNRGFRFAGVEVSQETHDEDATVELAFDIDEGAQMRIASVRLSGNERSWDSVLLGRIKLSPGDLYSEERIRQSYRALLRSGLFSSVNIESAASQDEEGALDLDVRVEEKSPWNLKFLLGYGSYERIRAGVTAENINVAGSGHSARLEGIVSFKGERATAGYLNPFFFHESLSHSASARYERREHPSFTSQELAAKNNFGYLLTEEIRTDLGYELVQSDVSDARSAVPPEFLDNVLLSMVSLTSVFEFRDSLIEPRSGTSHRLNVEYSGSGLGSEIDFLRYNFTSTWLFPIPGDLVLVLRGRAGLVDRLAGTEVIPIQERFFSGGENTIRSFLQDEAGPKQSGVPIGGEAMLVGNAELRFPILGNLRGAVFYDIGSVNEEIGAFGDGPYQSGVGGGLRYRTPFGPLRFDAAANPRRRPGEDSWAFHFALGAPF